MRTRMTGPTRVPTHLRILSTTFRTYQILLPNRRAQVSFAKEEGVEIALCSSWMKQRILLSLFRPVYQVVFTFRSCPTREADGVPRRQWMKGYYGPGDGEPQVARRLCTTAHKRHADPQTRIGISKNGVFEKNKGRHVARGNHQRPGIDYEESLLPIMRLESFRTILALAAIRDLDIIAAAGF